MSSGITSGKKYRNMTLLAMMSAAFAVVSLAASSVEPMFRLARCGYRPTW